MTRKPTNDWGTILFLGIVGGLIGFANAMLDEESWQIVTGRAAAGIAVGFIIYIFLLFIAALGE